MAIAAPVGQALAADAAAVARWSPYVEAGGMVGTRSFGDVDIFLPLWQDQGSLLFGDLRGTFSAQPTQEGNFGLGYRTLISPEWILGGYGYFDIANSPHDNLFYQITLGVELKSVDWDVRLNGYVPINPDGQSIKNNSNPSIHIHGNTIQMQTESQKEKALYGFDGEVGWRVPLFPPDGDFDLRVYAGGYYFTNSDVDTIAGPRGRIEARLYDIDFLGLQSRLTAQGVVQWDSPRGVQGFGGLELRIPLGAITGTPGPKLSSLDRRMVDRVQRDVDIVTGKTNKEKKNEDVIVDELTVSTHTIVFANAGGKGSGAEGSPVDLNQAPLLGKTLGSNAIIIADGGAGPNGVTQPLQLEGGQALIGGGSVVPLHGAKSGKTVDFAFPGTRPTLNGTDGSNDLIHMYSGGQNRVTGLDLRGVFADGIFGKNMQRAVITDNTVAGALEDGIRLLNASDDLVLSSAFVDIRGNVISDSGENGILIETYIGPVDHAAHAQTILISDNVVSDNGDNGILVHNIAVGTGSVLTQSLSITGNTVESAPSVGIYLHNLVSSGGAMIQTAVIDDNLVEHVEGGNFVAGITVRDDVHGPAGRLDQSLTVAGNRIEGVTAQGNFNHAAGISTATFVSSGGVLNQTAFVNGNTVNNIAAQYARGIDGEAFVIGADASLSQALTIDGNTVSGINGSTAAAGIGVNSAAFSGAAILQALTIDDNLVFDIFGDRGAHGIGGLTVASAASIIQTIDIATNAVSHVDAAGVNFLTTYAEAITLFSIARTGGVVTQTVSLLGNSVSNITASVYAVGLYVGSKVSAGTFRGIVSIAGNTVADVEAGLFAAGIGAFDRATAGTLTQTVGIADNAVSQIGSPAAVGIGIAADSRASSHGAIDQALTLTDNTVTSADDGINVYSRASGAGAVISQAITITGNALSKNDLDGLFIGGHASSSGTVTQNGTIVDNVVSANGRDGVFFKAVAEDANPAIARQTFSVASNAITDNLGSGVYLFASGGGASQFVVLTTAAPGNEIAGNGKWGVLMSDSVNAHQTFAANSTQIGGSGPNLLLPNTSGPYLTAGVGSQIFTK